MHQQRKALYEKHFGGLFRKANGGQSNAFKLKHGKSAKCILCRSSIHKIGSFYEWASIIPGQKQTHALHGFQDGILTEAWLISFQECKWLDKLHRGEHIDCSNQSPGFLPTQSWTRKSHTTFKWAYRYHFWSYISLSFDNSIEVDLQPDWSSRGLSLQYQPICIIDWFLDQLGDCWFIGCD